MRIRCPHCLQKVEILNDDPLIEVNCPSCGSSFGLVGAPVGSTIAWAKRNIAHFELLDEVGRGAFGSVWKAKDTELDRLVAVKLPRKEQLDALEEELFLREARAAAQLRHPNLVRVYEVGKDGSGQLYIVSEFIQGANLAEWLSIKPLDIAETVELMIKLCDAAHHAHMQGVVHRDMKPQNILMDEQGNPHVTDFGLAKRDAAEITVTVDGKILGTPAYMPPEQAAGNSSSADRRSDVYSLGVILFELLTGELPFRGSTSMLLIQILNDDPPSPRKLNSRIPKDLETITLKCLEKDANHRYQTAADLHFDLLRFLSGEPILARRRSVTYQICRFVAKHKLVFGAATTVLLLLLVISNAYFRLNRSKSELIRHGAITVSNRKHTHVRSVPSNLGNDSFAWRVYIPAGKRCMFGYSIGEFSSFAARPDNAQIEFPICTFDREILLQARFEFEPKKEKWMLRFGGDDPAPQPNITSGIGLPLSTTSSRYFTVDRAAKRYLRLDEDKTYEYQDGMPYLPLAAAIAYEHPVDESGKEDFKLKWGDWYQKQVQEDVGGPGYMFWIE